MNKQSVVTGHRDRNDHPGLASVNQPKPIILRGKRTIFARSFIFMLIGKLCLPQDWIKEMLTIRGKVHLAPQDIRPSISPKLPPRPAATPKWSFAKLDP